MATSPSIDALVNEPTILGECPVWSAAAGVLWWIDIEGQRLHRTDPATGADDTAELPGQPGSIGLTADPNVLVMAMAHQFGTFDWTTRAFSPLLDLEEAGNGNRLNDGRVDPAGRFVVGSMWADTAAGKTTGSMYSITRTDGELTSTVLFDGITVANGVGFDGDRGRMYFADTPSDQVSVFDYDVDSGACSNRRAFADLTGTGGKPDGACVDADGCYWAAAVYGWAVLRFTPDGAVDRRIDLPVQKPSMPAFGGPGLDTLFVTTIGAGGTVPSAPGKDGVEPGALLAIDAGVTGRPEPIFDDPNA